MTAMDSIVTILISWSIPFLALWIAGFGISYMFGKQKWYVNATKKFFVWPLKEAWKVQGRAVVWFTIGFAVATFLFLGSQPVQ